MSKLQYAGSNAEKCTACGKVIPLGQTPMLFGESVMCEGCHELAMANMRRHAAVPGYIGFRRRWAGVLVIAMASAGMMLIAYGGYEFLRAMIVSVGAEAVSDDNRLARGVVSAAGSFLELRAIVFGSLGLLLLGGAYVADVVTHLDAKIPGR